MTDTEQKLNSIVTSMSTKVSTDVKEFLTAHQVHLDTELAAIKKLIVDLSQTTAKKGTKKSGSTTSAPAANGTAETKTTTENKETADSKSVPNNMNLFKQEYVKSEELRKKHWKDEYEVAIKADAKAGKLYNNKSGDEKWKHQAGYVWSKMSASDKDVWTKKSADMRKGAKPAAPANGQLTAEK
jgi:hypothetical protein